MLFPCLILLTLAAGDEEAVRPDGRHTSGTLTIDTKGCLCFTPKGEAALPPEALTLLRFPTAASPVNRPSVGVRVMLPDGQHLSGQLLALDDKTLSLRPAWADKIELPRAAVAAVTQLPGWRTVVEDDFRDGGKAWTVTGKPAVDAGTGRITLGEKGQSAAYALAQPLDGGRAGIAFVETEAARGGRWTFAAEFGDEKRPRVVRVTVAGAGETYAVDAGGLDGVSRRVSRTAGLHRLLVQHTPRSLRLTIDDQVLWYNLDAGPGGPLRQVRLECSSDDKVQGAVAFGEFFLARAVDEPRRPSGDATQDEVLRGDGDQLFGRILSADSRTVAFDCSGKRTLPWSALSGLWLRRDAVSPHTTDGAHVRAAVRTCLCAEPDLLDGVATALDDKALTLKHALFGEVRIERNQLHTLRPLFYGTRIEIDNAFHHLGDPQAFTARLQPPRAEGLELKRTFALDEVPDNARLVLNVVQLKSIKETGARVTVYLNGERLDDLNRHVDKAISEPLRLALPLPKERLRKGENVLELKLMPSPETRRVEPCGVFGVMVEVPR